MIKEKSKSVTRSFITSWFLITLFLIFAINGVIIFTGKYNAHNALNFNFNEKSASPSKIQICAQPISNFTMNSTVVLIYDKIQFNFTGDLGDEPASFQWNFGDNSGNSTKENPVHMYYTEGNYTVALTIQDSDGDISIFSSSNVITVLDFYEDNDNDELSNYDELRVYGLNPLSSDTDNDGYLDNEEINSGSDPKDVNSIPETSNSPNIIFIIEISMLLAALIFIIYLATYLLELGSIKKKLNEYSKLYDDISRRYDSLNDLLSSFSRELTNLEEDLNSPHFSNRAEISKFLEDVKSKLNGEISNNYENLSNHPLWMIMEDNELISNIENFIDDNEETQNLFDYPYWEIWEIKINGSVSELKNFIDKEGPLIKNKLDDLHKVFYIFQPFTKNVFTKKIKLLSSNIEELISEYSTTKEKWQSNKNRFEIIKEQVKEMKDIDLLEKANIPVLGIGGAGKTWFMAGLAYRISQGIPTSNKFVQPAGFIPPPVMTYLVERINLIMHEETKTTPQGKLNPCEIGIFLEEFDIEDDNGKKIEEMLWIRSEDISGEDYLHREPRTYDQCIKNADAVVVLIDSTTEVTIVDQMACAASIPLDLLKLGTDIKNVPFAFVFSKADKSEIKDIRDCGDLSGKTIAQEEIVRVLAPIKAIIEFHNGIFGLFSVSVTSNKNGGINTNGFDALIKWLCKNLFKTGRLNQKDEARQLRAEEKRRIPVVGILGAGKSTFLAALGQWLSLGGRSGNGSWIPYGYISEGLNYIARLLADLQKGDSDISRTSTTGFSTIGIYIDPSRMGIENCEPFEIISGDISGESYQFLDKNFIESVRNSDGLIIIIEKVGNNQSDQMRKAANAIEILARENLNALYNKIFCIVLSKGDILKKKNDPELGQNWNYGLIKPNQRS
ncbi:MAG: PKD domain-containing protein, partial [Promethearchaeota archaeon]